METVTEYKTEKTIEVMKPTLRQLEEAKVKQLEYDLNEIKDKLMAEGFVANYDGSLTWESKKLQISCTVTFNGITSAVEYSYYDECIGEAVEEENEVETTSVAEVCIDKLTDLIG